MQRFFPQNKQHDIQNTGLIYQKLEAPFCSNDNIPTSISGSFLESIKLEKLIFSETTELWARRHWRHTRTAAFTFFCCAVYRRKAVRKTHSSCWHIWPLPYPFIKTSFKTIWYPCNHAFQFENHRISWKTAEARLLRKYRIAAFQGAVKNTALFILIFDILAVYF